MAFFNSGTLFKPNVQSHSATFVPSSDSDGNTEFIALLATDHESQLQEEARRCIRQQKRYWDFKDNKLIMLSASFTRINGFSGRKVSVVDRETFLTCFADLPLLKKKIQDEAKLLIEEWHKQPKNVQKVTVSKEYPLKQYAFSRSSKAGYRTNKSLQTLILTTYQYTDAYSIYGAGAGPLTPQKLNVYIKLQSTAMNQNVDHISSRTSGDMHYDVWGFGVGLNTFLEMIESPIFEDFRRRVQNWRGAKLTPNTFSAKQALVDPKDPNTWAQHIANKTVSTAMGTGDEEEKENTKSRPRNKKHSGGRPERVGQNVRLKDEDSCNEDDGNTLTNGTQQSAPSEHD